MKTTETRSAQTPPDHDAALEQLHADMAKGHALPTWVYVSKLVTPEPVAGYRPYLWKWELFHDFLMRAGELVTPGRGSERRSMEHLNPDLASVVSTSHTIGTAFQLVQPGEVAPAHRHTAAAIRFVVQGGGGEVFTAVQGEKLLMEENDLVLTPRWCWHDHANETSRPIIWLDALDYPLVNLLRTSFFEPYPEKRQPITRPVHYTAQRVGLARPTAPYPEAVPLVRYAWADTAPLLESLRDSEGSAYDGVLLEYVNPFTSGPTLPDARLLHSDAAAGEHTQSHRATTSTVYLVTRGQGYTVIGGQRFDWTRGDVFVVPPWTWHEHANQAAGDSLLFSVTDRPVLDAFGHYREEALAANDGHQEITSVFEPLTRV